MGAGSFDLADCTRCSNLCICAVSVRICVRDVELGSPRVAGAFVRVFRMTDGVAIRFRTVLMGVGPGPMELRRLEEMLRTEGLGVVLELPEGSFNLLLGGLIGVFETGRVVAEASDIGGEGGVGVSETACIVDNDRISGGVVIIGDEAVETGEDGESGAVISVERDRCLFRSLSCMISASIFKSESSSRSLCVSIRRFSRSCSPILISSSIMTARSMATLYFDSRSSSDEEVFRACLSKSSFATSISRSFSCNVLFESRSVVISLCRVFCAAPASVLDCLYLDWKSQHRFPYRIPG
jgi:hypothetical protein